MHATNWPAANHLSALSVLDLPESFTCIQVSLHLPFAVWQDRSFSSCSIQYREGAPSTQEFTAGIKVAVWSGWVGLGWVGLSSLSNRGWKMKERGHYFLPFSVETYCTVAIISMLEVLGRAAGSLSRNLSFTPPRKTSLCRICKQLLPGTSSPSAPQSYSQYTQSSSTWWALNDLCGLGRHAVE